MAFVKSRSERDFRLIKSTSAKVDGNDFNLMRNYHGDFNKIKVGQTTLSNDVTANITISTKNVKLDRASIIRAIEQRDLKTLRVASQIFFDKSGIYSRLCRYMAYLYRYDWFITPVVYDNQISDNKVIEGWYKSSCLLENSRLKKLFGEIALSVVKNGCYYGYRIPQKSAGYLQELPVNYCRSRYKVNGQPAVEFNIKYFNDAFKDMEQRKRVLKMFPKEFQRAWISFQKGTLPQDFAGDAQGWFMLEPKNTVKFGLTGSDAPLFAPTIPLLMDLEDAQDLDKAKAKQQLLRIIIQKMPIDKNGDLIFDTDEARALHNNAVQMLADAIGVDVLTTFADVDVADMSDNSRVTSADYVEKIKNSVFDNSGVSQKQFNTDGNLALEKSIANDAATMSDLLCQFEEYSESLLKPFNKNPKRLIYRVEMLPTTIYNYVDLSKIYKEQTMLGFSKLLPQVALGHSQSSVIATAYFENELLNLDELFVPPQMSSTMSNDDNNNSNQNKESEAPTEQGGRPQLADDEKSAKTIQNKESEG